MEKPMKFEFAFLTIVLTFLIISIVIGGRHKKE